MKVFVQNEADADSLSMDGFSNLEHSYGNDRILPSEHTENTGFL